MDNFEYLLRQQSEKITTQDKIQKKESPRMRAEKSADLRDFIKMVAKVVSVAMKEQQVEFVPDEGRRPVVDPDSQIDHPYIYYKVVSRKHKDERKPRARESISENTYVKNESREGVVYGQKFVCIVQFDIVAGEYNTADSVMYNFEDAILKYTYYFKKNGVAEILFNEHFTDENYDIFRQNVSVRNIRYYVEVEKLTAVFSSEIEDIEII